MSASPDPTHIPKIELAAPKEPMAPFEPLATGRWWEPEQEAPRLGYTIVDRVQVRDSYGFVNFANKQLVLSPDLLPIRRRCTCAHEIAHIVLGHDKCLGVNEDGTYPEGATIAEIARERAADELACRWLMDLVDVAAVIEMRLPPREAADMLRVTDRHFEIRLRLFRGDERPLTA